GSEILARDEGGKVNGHDRIQSAALKRSRRRKTVRFPIAAMTPSPSEKSARSIREPEMLRFLKERFQTSKETETRIAPPGASYGRLRSEDRERHHGSGAINDWLPPRFWSCPQCLATILTRDAAPRCGRCGFREDNS